MRKFFFPLAVAAVPLLTATPAVAANPSFAPYVQTTIDNGMGPGPAPRGSATADFNSDGKPDVVTILDFTQGNILLVTGDGDGTFTPGAEIAGTSGTQGLDAGDVNGDGKADVIAATTSQMKVEYGNGSGEFTAGPTYSQTLGGQVEPRLLDLDGDGDLDVAAPTFTAIQTLLNNGNGTFAVGPTTQLSGACAVSAISPAKLNGDGKKDLFAVDGCSSTVYALKSNGGGAFTATGTLYASGGLVPEDIEAIDLNGDGFDDMATIGSFSFTLATALTNGQGAFVGSLSSYQFGGVGPTSLSSADLNRDGKTDLVVSWLASAKPGVTVLAGNGTVGMQKVGDFSVGSLPQNPMLIDFDGDRKRDIVTAGPGALSFLRNTTP
ncbi:MAG TPA: VCBS repeat-containing protein [Aeromicrobium sp.]|nr:VCBS repeat-containing protein [Aeromicrobium sp.]